MDCFGKRFGWVIVCGLSWPWLEVISEVGFKCPIQTIVVSQLTPSNSFCLLLFLPKIRIDCITRMVQKESPEAYLLINSTASSYFIPLSIRASATRTGALRNKSTGIKAPVKQMKHFTQHHVTVLHLFHHPVARCCIKFELGSTFHATSRNISIVL